MLRSPKFGETSLDVFKSRFDSLTSAEKIAVILEHMPELLAGHWYWKSVRKFGGQTWWAPHNWFRQLFHAVGGLTFGIVPQIIGWPIIGVVAAVAYSVNKEFGEVRNRSFGWNTKNFLDILFWGLGASAWLIL